MSIIRFQQDSYTIPDTWNELTTTQLELIAKIVLSTVYPLQLLVKLALSFLGMRLSNRKPVYVNDEQYHYIRHSWRKVYLVNSVQVHEITKCVEFILKDGQVASELTKNPYPEIHFRFSRLIGPADSFANLTFGEFIQAEIERNQFIKTDKPQHFHRQLAILWRPTFYQHPDSDPRTPLRMDEVDQRARKVARLQPYQKRVIQWYIDGCLQSLYKQFPGVFSTGEGSGTGTVFESFMKMVNLLARNKLVDVEKIREAYLYDALFTLQGIIEENENRK